MTLCRALTVATLLAAGLSAPSALRAQDAANCSVETIDPVHLQRGPALRDCDVQQRASKRREPRIEFSFPAGVSCAFVEFEFVIDTTGIPDTSAAIVVVDASNAEFVTFVRERLGEFRFRPAKHDGKLVRQVYRLRVVRQLPEKRSFTVTEVRSSDGRVVGSSAMPPRQPSAGAPTTARCR